MKKKHILIISFAYPPLNFIGAFRISKISKNLLEEGYIPHVITADHGDPDVKSEIEIPDDLVHYVKWNDPYRMVVYFLSKNNLLFQFLGKVLRVLIPFGTTRLPEVRRQFWRKPAYQKALELIEKYPIEIIYSSSSPPSSAIIASRLQQRKGIPWIAEFRDLWTGNPYNTKNKIHHFFEERIEKKILSRASAFITISKPLAVELERMHKKPCYIVYNGFDSEDYKGKPIEFGNKFIITHAGSIYKGKRDPSSLFEAINILKGEKDPLVKNIEVLFYGARLERVIGELIKKYGVQDNVTIVGLKPRKEIITVQKKSALLLLLTWVDVRAIGTLTGKIFEYLGCKRPILAVSLKGGAIDQLLDESNTGTVLNESQEIAEFLKEKLQDWNDNKYSLGFEFKDVNIDSYSRSNQTKQLIKVIEKTLVKR